MFNTHAHQHIPYIILTTAPPHPFTCPCSIPSNKNSICKKVNKRKTKAILSFTSTCLPLPLTLAHSLSQGYKMLFTKFSTTTKNKVKSINKSKLERNEKMPQYKTRFLCVNIIWHACRDDKKQQQHQHTSFAHIFYELNSFCCTLVDLQPTTTRLARCFAVSFHANITLELPLATTTTLTATKMSPKPKPAIFLRLPKGLLPTLAAIHGIPLGHTTGPFEGGKAIFVVVCFFSFRCLLFHNSCLHMCVCVLGWVAKQKWFRVYGRTVRIRNFKPCVADWSLQRITASNWE